MLQARIIESMLELVDACGIMKMQIRIVEGVPEFERAGAKQRGRARFIGARIGL